MSKIHQLFSYFSYWLNEENEHSLQAPFIYDLYKKVIKSKDIRSEFEDIEKVRSQFLKSDKIIDVVDYGSGSTKSKKISKIVSMGISSKKYAQLLNKLINYLDAKRIIELGTSLGITTLYLSTEQDSTITTFEGDPSLSAIASAVFAGNNRKNVSIIEGNIDATLPSFIDTSQKVDLVYFDANHTFEATTSYFDMLLKLVHDNTCFVFDDIHRSAEMERAWNKIKAYFEVTLTVDLFQMGIVFFNPEIRKQDYTLTF